MTHLKYIVLGLAGGVVGTLIYLRYRRTIHDGIDNIEDTIENIFHPPAKVKMQPIKGVVNFSNSSLSTQDVIPQKEIVDTSINGASGSMGMGIHPVLTALEAGVMINDSN